MTKQAVEVVVDHRVRIREEGLPAGVRAALKKEFDHPNPERVKRRRLGKSLYGVPTRIKTWSSSGGVLSLPRGGATRIKKVLTDAGIAPVFRDRRVRLEPVDFPQHRVRLRWYQQDALSACLSKEQGIVRAPTGSGKTTMAFAAIVEMGQPALVVMAGRPLMKQWLGRIESELGIHPREVGIIGAGKRRVGPRVTLALQQTLRSEKFPLADFASRFGTVIIDECFEGSSPVLMADGTLRAISEVEPGDEVAVGGRVTHRFRRFFEGRLWTLGDALATADHRVATPQGWTRVSLAGSGDLFWYDSDHDQRETLRPLRCADQKSQSVRLVPEAWSGSVRSDHGEVQVVRGGSRTSSERRSRQHLRERRPVECWVDDARFGVDSRICGEAAWSTESQGAGDFGEDPKDSRFQAGACTRAAKAIREIERAAGCQSESSPLDKTGGDHSVWRQGSRKRGGANGSGNRVSKTARASRFRGGGRDHDQWGDPCEVVPGGLRSSRSPCSSRARRGESSGQEAAKIGQNEGFVSSIEGLVGSQIPGGRLRLDSARVCERVAFSSCAVFDLETEHGAYVAGGVLVHNCHQVAAATFVRSVDAFPARYRIGITADERRKDRKEFLIHDVMGPAIHEVEREVLEESGDVLPVVVRLIPTDFEADWYVQAPADEKDFGALLDEMTEDEERNEIVTGAVVKALEYRERPVLVFTRRRAHAELIADVKLFARGIKTGLMLGGVESATRYDEDLARVKRGELDAAVGTIEATGTGIDVPMLRAGVIAQPLGNNPFLFNQVRGRICRPHPGKREGVLYWVWDRLVWPKAPAMLRRWTGDRVEAWGGTAWVPADGRGRPRG